MNPVHYCNLSFKLQSARGLRFCTESSRCMEQVHCYDPELIRPSAEWWGFDKPRPTKFRQEPSALKQMMIFAYTSERVIAHRVPPRATVNKEYYSDFIRRLRFALSRKQPDILRARSLLLHDNATCHQLRQFVTAFAYDCLRLRESLRTIGKFSRTPISPGLRPPTSTCFRYSRKP